MIDPSSITFLVQGPVKIVGDLNLTQNCIASIQKFFPKSKIIFSTNYGEDVKSLKVDKVQFSVPSILPLIENDSTGHIMSVNYQICSTRAGLREVETPFTVKLRSDMLFKNDNLIGALSDRPQRPKSKYVLTNSYVLVLDWSTVDPRRFLKFPHHPSDHFYAGETEDIKEIWNVPEMPAEYMRWFEHKEFPINARHGNNFQLFRAEAWIWYNYVKKFTKHKVNSSYETSDAIIEESLGFMCSNLLVNSSHLIGVYENSLQKRDWKTKVKMFTYYEWYFISRKFGVRHKSLKLDINSIKILILKYVISLLRLERLIYTRNS
jgi:hypothetical protein